MEEIRKRGKKSGGSAKPNNPERSVSAEGKDRRGKKRYEIDIFRGWCKCCGICAAFCPVECIRLDEDGSPTVPDPDRCTGCGWCELHCPDFAISVREKNHADEREGET